MLGYFAASLALGLGVRCLVEFVLDPSVRCQLIFLHILRSVSC